MSTEIITPDRAKWLQGLGAQFVSDVYYCSACHYEGTAENRRCVTCEGTAESASGDCAACRTGTMEFVCPQCGCGGCNDLGEAFASVVDFEREDLPRRIAAILEEEKL